MKITDLLSEKTVSIGVKPSPNGDVFFVISISKEIDFIY